MARLMKRHLPHRIDLRPVLGETAEGVVYGEWETDIPAVVQQKSKLVIDRRTTSETTGKQVTATTQIVILPTHDPAPGTEVKVWKGTPRERTSTVLDSALGHYNARTPNHVELYAE